MTVNRCSVFLITVIYLLATDAHVEHQPPIETPGEPLSDHQHFSDSGKHDLSYDHEVFLGKDEAKVFDDLEPEQAKKKLGEIAKKIDVDGNGLITAQEIENWIAGNIKRYSLKNTNDRMKQWDKNKDEKISWSEYVANFDSAGHTNPRKEQLRSDERRFDKADMNDDGQLSREELTFFLHPEESPLMQDVLAEETLEMLDKNKDNELSLKEFAGDGNGKLSESLVNGVAHQFNELDKNKNGKLDKEELLPWIMPNEAEAISNEAMHLLSQADGNMDHMLSYEEMVGKFEAFVGSKATHYGDLLRPNPDL